MKKRPVPTKESARTGVVHSIAFMSDLQVTQDGEYVKVANTLDANLRALDTAIQSGGQQTDYSLTIQTPTSPDASYAAQYEFRQCGDVLATINIPKDMVVQEGSVVDITFSEDHLYDGQTDVTEKIKGAGVTPTEADAGKYVKLVIANKTDSTLYIKATDLVDVYTAQQSAAQVQLAISNANEISATIVAGSIGTTELSSGVNASLAKADTALQASDVVSTYDAESTAPVNGVAVAAAIAAVDVSGKADKVENAVSGNFAALDANGNLTDSGKNASDFAEADHTHDSLVNGDTTLSLSQAGAATVTIPGPDVTVYRLSITGGTVSANGGSSTFQVPSGMVDIPITFSDGKWSGSTTVDGVGYSIGGGSFIPDNTLSIVSAQGGYPFGAYWELDGNTTQDGVPAIGNGPEPVFASDVAFSGTLDSITRVSLPGPDTVKTLATTDDVQTAINALDASVTSTTGTNVQVKVNQTDGKITGVYITKDDTYVKPSDGIPGSDIANGAIDASKLAGLESVVLMDTATTGPNVRRRWKMFVLDGRLMLEDDGTGTYMPSEFDPLHPVYISMTEVASGAAAPRDPTRYLWKVYVDTEYNHIEASPWAEGTPDIPETCGEFVDYSSEPIDVSMQPSDQDPSTEEWTDRLWYITWDTSFTSQPTLVCKPGCDFTPADWELEFVDPADIDGQIEVSGAAPKRKRLAKRK